MAIKHSTRTHAILSASASARWIACPPSAKLCAEIPDVTTDYAREGTCAHELAEYKVNKILGIDAADPTGNLDFYDSEPEILGITAMTKLLGGKKKFDELLSKYVFKPQGKPTLVPLSDKRKEWSAAQEDFKE